MSGLSDREIIAEAIRIEQEFGEEASAKFLAQGVGSDALDPRVRSAYEYDQKIAIQEQQVKRLEKAKRLRLKREQAAMVKDLPPLPKVYASESESGASGPESTSNPQLLSPSQLRTRSPRPIVSAYFAYLFQKTISITSTS